MSDVNIIRIRRLLDELSFEEKLSIIEYVAVQLRQMPESGSMTCAVGRRDLYGLWREQIPEDLDLDSMLVSIRHEWEKEWSQESNK